MKTYTLALTDAELIALYRMIGLQTLNHVDEEALHAVRKKIEDIPLLGQPS